MAEGYIYVIDPRLQSNGRSIVKIGYTTRSPQKRLKELQTSLPHQAFLVHAAKFPNVKWAEKYLHNALSGLSVKAQGGTEFFYLTPEEAKEFGNKLAYQVSADEAKKALEAELDNFKEKISNGLQFKFAGVFALAAFFATLYFPMQDSQEFSFAFLILLAFVAIGPALFAAMFGMGIGSLVVGDIWRNEIDIERERLLEKYPAVMIKNTD